MHGRVLAHAFGARYDLPIPLFLFVLGGAAVVLVSFAVILPRPVSADAAPPATDRTTVRPLYPEWGILGCLVLAFLVWCGFTGNQEVPENILPTTFWLLIWIAVPLSCGLLGDWTQPVNPFAFLSKVADSDRARQWLLGRPDPLPWPRGLGWWVAAVLYFATACGELIYNLTATLPSVVATMLASYALLCLAAGLLFGRGWLERGEMFAVVYGTWGRLGFFRFGAPGRRRFAGGLDVPFEATASRIALVLLLLVSVNFDGLLATPKWRAFELGLPSALGSPGGPLDGFRTGVFAALALSLAVVFGGFAYAAARAGLPRVGVRSALAGLLPSLLPIAFGYLLAHNIEYLLINGQLMAPLIGNPTGLPSWPLHLPYPFNDSFEPFIHFLPPAFYWYCSVLVIVAVHVLAVLLAHRYLARRGRTAVEARRGEYPWLVAMVAYTMLSLWLIAQPLAQEKPTPSPATSGTSTASATAQRALIGGG